MKKVGLMLVMALLSFSSIQAEVAMRAFSEPSTPMNFASDKSYEAVIQTSKGKIYLKLFPEKAPLSVTNFIQLAEGGFYENLIFHRVVPNFVIQGGDPQGNGRGGPGYTVPAEIGLPHLEGALAWARLPDTVNPDKRSSGSQFYISLTELPYLNGEYTVFGQTTQGLDVIRAIEKGDRIEKIQIIVR